MDAVKLILHENRSSEFQELRNISIATLAYNCIDFGYDF
jgi:hypothetical protein